MSTKPGKINARVGYADKQNQSLVAASLLYFGYTAFKRASVIKQFDALSAYFNKQKEDSDLQSQFPDVFYDSVVDALRIGLCFENYFKAKLLLSGMVVHVIDKSQNEALFRAQKTRPVEAIKAIPAVGANLASEESGILKKQTLSYEMLLENPEYSKYYEVDAQILSFLSDLEKKGNRLHLYNFEKGGIGKKTLANFAALIQFVDAQMASLHSSLVKNLDTENKKRLSFK